MPSSARKKKPAPCRDARKDSPMSNDASRSRRSGLRAFRPRIDQTEALESRFLLSSAVAGPDTFASIAARSTVQRVPPIQTRTANGGQSVAVTDTDGEVYYVNLLGGGVVRAYFLFDEPAGTEIYTLSLHDALPI